MICGRTLFDFTNGWNGRHTMGVPVVAVTHETPIAWIDAHPGAPFSFVDDGVQAAVQQAQAIAGDRTVAVAAGTIARQCLELDLLDTIAVDLVPVVMGKGRPFFGQLSLDDVPLGNPTVCTPSDRVGLTRSAPQGGGDGTGGDGTGRQRSRRRCSSRSPPGSRRNIRGTRRG